MKVALATLVAGAPDALEEHVSFHLAVGADVVLVGRGGDDIFVGDRRGRVRCVDATTHTELARLAVAEHEADWVVPSLANEFWWPRGESLPDVLAVVPPRYMVVQALVRTFAGARSQGERFADEMIVRTSLLGPRGRGERAIPELLRPVYRADSDMTLHETDWTLHGARVPLRAWYPLEVMRFPTVSSIAPEEVDAGLADRSLVLDVRLRGALQALGDPAGELVLPVPTVVDDASYAVECAAVGEVDIEALDSEIRELELRIAALEARLGPRVRRALRRLARRPR